MKASELRIGNLIQWEDESNDIVCVKSIFTDVDEADLPAVVYYKETSREETGGAQLDEFIPVLLTEEWLLKFGFNDYSELNRENTFGNDLEHHNVYYIGEDEEHQVHFITSKYGGEVTKEIVFYKGAGYDHITAVEYVHQLQNLYFALTREELSSDHIIPKQ